MHRGEKLSFFIVVLITFLISLLDIVGISILLPILNLMTGGASDNQLVNGLVNYLPLTDMNSLAVFVCLFFILKFFTFLLVVLVQAKFIFGFKVKYSQLLAGKILTEDLGKDRETSENLRLRMLTVDLNELTGRFVAPLIASLSEIISLVLMATLAVALISPSFYMFLSLLGATVALFFLVFGRFSTILGLRRNSLESQRLGLVEFLFSGQIDIRTFAKTRPFIYKIGKILDNLRGVESMQEVMQQMPRMFIETVFVIIFLSFFVIQSDNQNLVQNNLSEIILLGVLVVRSLPSVNRLLRALQTLAYSKNILADFMREIVQDENISDWQAGADESEVETTSLQAVRLSNIQAGYGDDLAIHISDLELVRGRWYGLVGESGTGKSTLLKVFLGQMQPNSGEIRVYRDGVEEVLKGLYHWSNASIVSQNYPVIEGNMADNVRFDFLPNEERTSSEDIIISLTEAALMEPDKDDVAWHRKKIERGGINISGGQRQRIAIARALYANSDILVLDESTSALDEAQEDQLLDNLKKITTNKIVIFITHRQKNYRYFDEIIDMDRGGEVRVNDAI